eukprot:8580374-Karenia_brevis.AAC.1
MPLPIEILQYIEKRVVMQSKVRQRREAADVLPSASAATTAPPRRVPAWVVAAAAAPLGAPGLDAP